MVYKNDSYILIFKKINFEWSDLAAWSNHVAAWSSLHSPREMDSHPMQVAEAPAWSVPTMQAHFKWASTMQLAEFTWDVPAGTSHPAA